MTTREQLSQVLSELPERRLPELLDFAQYLSWREEVESWRQAGLEQFAKAYGDDEPEYSAADIKVDHNR